MNHNFQEVVLQATGAESLYHIEDIQSLWSGYGKIMRYGLNGADRERVVVKHVKLPDAHDHPRGWNTDLSHQRKIRSYQVETAWYRDWASHCDQRCRVPACLALESDADEFLMVFEDLDASGFPLRKSAVSLADMHLCLNWLAHFHATFLGETPRGLWETGSYWHLDTRPDEWEVMDDIPLKQAAGEIDAVLRAARFQTFIHGDAKLANFCFSADGKQVAALDFQYVGGGCGMKDIAYFIGSCLYEEACEKHEAELLDVYFNALGEALTSRGQDVDLKAIEQEWRPLYPVAWTDFHRFMNGWSPGHWKIHSYSERLARQVLEQLNTKTSQACD
jgi:hypothetical protein